MFGGVVLYLVTFAFTRWQLFRTLAVPRLTAAVVVAVMWLFHEHLTALESLATLAIVVATLNTVKFKILPKTLHPDSEPAA